MTDSMEDTDAALVEASLGGSREAFAQLVLRYQDQVYNIVYQVTRDRHEAADITQEAFVRAYRRLATYRPGYSFRNWVMAIAVNGAKNRFRDLARRRRAEEQHAALRETAAPGNDGARRAVLHEALAALPEKWRTPLVLKYMEGLSYDEIAGVLRIRVSAAKMRTLRARERLKELLEGGTRETAERPA